MLVTVAPTQPMSKSQKRQIEVDGQTFTECVSVAQDALDKDMQTLCHEYSSLVSRWMINEMSVNQSSFELAATQFTRNFLLVQNIKDLQQIGEHITKTEIEVLDGGLTD